MLPQEQRCEVKNEMDSDRKEVVRHGHYHLGK